MGHKKDYQKMTGVHAHWTHEKKPDNYSVTGYFILPRCQCSNCGEWQSSERKICPKCKAIMDQQSD